MSRRLLGAWFKVVDYQGSGTDLGTLMVPEEIGRHLEREKIAWTDYERLRLPSVSLGPFDPHMESMNIRQFHIVRGYHPHEDAIMLIGLSPEEIGKERGFRFIPSLEYLRTALAPPAPALSVEPKPEPSGPYLAAAREFSA